MNRLPLNTRKLILSMLVEGSSLRSISRTADASINTVTKMLMDAGEVCARLHDQLVQNVQSERVQVDEIWSFCYAKQRTVAAGGPLGSTEAGNVWT